MSNWLRNLSIATLTLIAVACGGSDKVTAPVAGDPTTVLPIVVNLVGVSTNPWSTKLTWVAPTGADPKWTARVYRDGKLVGNANSFDWAEAGLTPNTTYRYRVALVRADGSEAMSSNTVFLTTPPANATRVDIGPPSNEATVGTPIQLTAIVVDSATGAEDANQSVTWSSSDATIASVTQTGLFTPYQVGSVVITATSATSSGTKTFNVASSTVANAHAASVTVSPSSSTIDAGKTVQLSAIARNLQGQQVDRTIVWTTSNGNIATVSTTGVVTAVATGLATITAKADTASGTAQVTVRAATTSNPNDVASVTLDPHSLALTTSSYATLTATVRDGNGNVVTGHTIAWSSENPAIASVTQGGQVGGVTIGSTVIVATTEGVTTSAVVTVSAPANAAPAPVRSITVTPGNATIATGGSAQFTATVKDSANNTLTGRTIAWTSSNTSVGTVGADGRVIGIAAGSTTITATSEGKSATATLTVQSGAAPPNGVTTVTVSPATSNVVLGAIVSLTAEMRDAQGNVLTGRVVTWSVTSNNLALVSNTGYVTTIGVGTVTVTATSEGVAGTATIAVSAPALPVSVNTIIISPAVTAMPIGSTAQLTAVTKDNLGNTLTGRTVTWGTSDNAIATVSSTGLVTAVTTGAVTITATSEGKTGIAAVTVNPPAVGIVLIVPNIVPLVTGGSLPLVAITKTASGLALNGRNVVWTSSNPAVATVSSTGVATGVSVGSAVITATCEGVSGTANATVIIAPVSTITITPSALNLSVGQTGTLTPSEKDANGNVLVGRLVTWTSSDPTIAAVGLTGVVTATGVGSATITATSEGKTAQASVTVGSSIAPVASISLTTPSGLCAGASAQLNATLKDANGNILTGRVVVYTTSNIATATISPTGLIVGLLQGPVTVTATSEGVSASATISLCAPIVASVSISNAPSLLSLLGLPAQLVATPKDGNGNVVLNKTVSWSVSPSLKALISLGGLLTPLGLGPITVTATIDGISTSVVLQIGS